MSGGATETLARRWRQRVRAPAVVPDRLHGLRQHPSLGYLAAVLGQLAAVSLTVYLHDVWPQGFPYNGALPLLAVVAVALCWDFGPSLLATLVGAALVNVYVLPPYQAWSLGSAQGGRMLAFVTIGLGISVLASRTHRARLHAEAAAGREQAARVAAERTAGRVPAPGAHHARQAPRSDDPRMVRYVS